MGEIMPYEFELSHDAKKATNKKNCFANEGGA